MARLISDPRLTLEGQTSFRPLGQPAPQGIKTLGGMQQTAFNPTNAAMAQAPQAGFGVPPTGVIGAEQALQQGLGGGIDAFLQGAMQGRKDIRGSTGQAAGQLSQARQDIGQQIDQGVSGLNPFIGPGQQSQQVQAALSGALGPEAQAQAFADFRNSPGQDFLVEEAERGTTRNAAAIGGLGGGNVRRELQRQAIGLAQQDLQNQFARLGEVSGQGLTAAGQVGSLRGQEASLTGALGQTGANIFAQQGANLADIAQGTGRDVGNAFIGTGGQIAQGRSAAGRDIAGQIGTTTSALSDLIAQQGAGLSDITGQAGGNLVNLLGGAGAQQAGIKTDLATLLANIATGSASGTQPSTAINTGGNAGTATSILSTIGPLIGAIAASDERLKEDIKPIGKLKSGLNVYSWKWTKKAKAFVGNQPAFGVIAQEARKLFPEAVMTGPDGYLRVNYGAIS